MMETNYSTIQSLLLKWFRHHGSRTIQQINIACKNLNESFSMDINYPVFLFFIPLVRKGYVEFIGQGKYQPGPPAIILNKKEMVTTALNLKDSQIVYIQKTIKEVEGPDLFGVIRFKSSLQELKKICIGLDIDYTGNEIVHILSQFPRLKDVILKYKKTPISRCSHHYDVFNHRWEQVGVHDRLGIHKSDKNAQQLYFRMDQDVWLKIPSYIINPDSRYICESYQALLEKEKPYIFYKKTEQTLSIKKIAFPILIDRVLRVPSLYMNNRNDKNFKEQVYHNISVSAFKQLNRIFSNGIKCYE